jgi:predicted transcriptional regulator
LSVSRHSWLSQPGLEPYVASVVLADILPEREMPEQTPQSSYSGMAARIVAAYVRHHRLSPEQIAPLIPAVYGALLTTGVPENQGSDKLTPAVPVRRSIQRDHLACLECGFAAQSLRRHLRAAHGLTPDQYRTKWRLSPDYPMVSPEYSERRSGLAKRFGLGRKRKVRRVLARPAEASKKTRPAKPSKRRSRRPAAR